MSDDNPVWGAHPKTGGRGTIFISSLEKTIDDTFQKFTRDYHGILNSGDIQSVAKFIVLLKESLEIGETKGRTCPTCNDTGHVITYELSDKGHEVECPSCALNGDKANITGRGTNHGTRQNKHNNRGSSG
jgi:hypothetical protein